MNIRNKLLASRKSLGTTDGESISRRSSSFCEGSFESLARHVIYEGRVAQCSSALKYDEIRSEREGEKDGETEEMKRVERKGGG